MLLTILASLGGFLASTFPDILQLFKDKQDKNHEVELIKLQMAQAESAQAGKIQEVNANADIAESTSLYATYTTGVKWVDTLNGTVRPVITYCFFILYCYVKWEIIKNQLPWQFWTDDDKIIFTAIISFYFGSRAMSNARKGK